MLLGIGRGQHLPTLMRGPALPIAYNAACGLNNREGRLNVIV